MIAVRRAATCTIIAGRSSAIAACRAGQDGFEECRFAEALIRGDRLQRLRVFVHDPELAGVRESMFSQDEDNQRLRMIAAIKCFCRLDDCVAQFSHVVDAGELG